MPTVTNVMELAKVCLRSCSDFIPTAALSSSGERAEKGRNGLGVEEKNCLFDQVGAVSFSAFLSLQPIKELLSQLFPATAVSGYLMLVSASSLPNMPVLNSFSQPPNENDGNHKHSLIFSASPVICPVLAMN